MGSLVNYWTTPHLSWEQGKDNMGILALQNDSGHVALPIVILQHVFFPMLPRTLTFLLPGFFKNIL